MILMTPYRCHLFSAAFLAISLLRARVSFFARALPPSEDTWRLTEGSNLSVFPMLSSSKQNP